MNWYQPLLADLHRRAEKKGGKVLINDAKTPSGRVHVGSLRGVILHDAITKLAKRDGLSAEFWYELDDTDPMDGLPSDASPELKAQMGKPLYQVPSLMDPSFGDLANYYAQEFLGVMNHLGVDYKLLRARELYKEGVFNAAIDQILSKVSVVREVYLEVSGSKRDKDWHPFQVICENCGKIGTTIVSAYNGKEVRYRCEPHAVKWAQGCGHKGSVSPFDGRGKLPWKLEWPAKWQIFGVDLEGGGKDHYTKGGSRDVARVCAERIFGIEAPIDLPYEFFLFEGAKMSSSKGVGVSSKEMSDLLPKETLRYLMLKTPPRRAVSFSPQYESMVKLFNEQDQLDEKVRTLKADADEKSLFSVCFEAQNPGALPSFSLLVALCSLPHLDVMTALKSQRVMSPDEEARVLERLESVRRWMKQYAEPDSLLVIQERLSPKALALNPAQKAYLYFLRERLLEVSEAESSKMSEEDYQVLMFDAVRKSSVPPAVAFSAFYTAVLDKTSGPKGGSLMAFLGLPHFIELLEPIALDLQAYAEAVVREPEALLEGLQGGREVSRELLLAGVARVWLSDAQGRFWARLVRV